MKATVTKKTFKRGGKNVTSVEYKAAPKQKTTKRGNLEISVKRRGNITTVEYIAPEKVRKTKKATAKRKTSTAKSIKALPAPKEVNLLEYKPKGATKSHSYRYETATAGRKHRKDRKTIRVKNRAPKLPKIFDKLVKVTPAPAAKATKTRTAPKKETVAITIPEIKGVTINATEKALYNAGAATCEMYFAYLEVAADIISYNSNKKFLKEQMNFNAKELNKLTNPELYNKEKNDNQFNYLNHNEDASYIFIVGYEVGIRIKTSQGSYDCLLTELFNIINELEKAFKFKPAIFHSTDNANKELQEAIKVAKILYNAKIYAEHGGNVFNKVSLCNGAVYSSDRKQIFRIIVGGSEYGFIDEKGNIDKESKDYDYLDNFVYNQEIKKSPQFVTDLKSLEEGVKKEIIKEKISERKKDLYNKNPKIKELWSSAFIPDILFRLSHLKNFVDIVKKIEGTDVKVYFSKLEKCNNCLFTTNKVSMIAAGGKLKD